MTRTRIYIIIFFLLLFVPVAMAQKVTFKGLVTDQEQQPLAIANISIEGTVVGTVADLNGR